MKSHKTARYLLAFGIGAVVYSLLEILWRGYTHWTMTLTGGFCMVLLMFISAAPLALPLKWLAGAAAITLIEFTVGCIVNLALGWHVWDYSFLPLNLLGQISLIYSGLWFLLSIPAVYICEKLQTVPFRGADRRLP